MTPNLFDFATSELSQDAFLCWLLSCDNWITPPIIPSPVRGFMHRLVSTYS